MADQTYNYVDTSGAMKQVMASDWNTAIKTAPGIDPHSGVQLVVPPSDKSKQTTQPPVVYTSGPANDAVGKVQNTVDTFNNNTGVAGKTGEAVAKNLEELNSAYDNYNATISRINAGVLTQAEQQQIDAVKATFAQTKALQETANKNYTGGVTELGIRSGRQRYATEIHEGNIKHSIDQGIQKLTAIDTAQTKAVAEMTAAMQEADFNRATKLLETYNSLVKTKNDTLFNLANLAQEDQKLILDKVNMQQTELTKNYQAALNGGYKGSLLDFQRDMEKAKVNPTATIQEYQYAVSQGYKGTLTDFMAQGGASGSKTKLINKEEATRYNLPDSLIGKSEADIIQDISLQKVPQWFKDFVEKTEPAKKGTFTEGGWQSVWDSFRSRPDMQVFVHLQDINKAQSGKIQESGGGTSKYDLTRVQGVLPPEQL